MPEGNKIWVSGDGVESNSMGLPSDAMPLRGKRSVAASLVCAIVALLIASGVFGPLGVVADMVAVWKGSHWGGAAGVSGSAVALVVSGLVGGMARHVGIARC